MNGTTKVKDVTSHVIVRHVQSTDPWDAIRCMGHTSSHKEHPNTFKWELRTCYYFNGSLCKEFFLETVIWCVVTYVRDTEDLTFGRRLFRQGKERQKISEKIKVVTPKFDTV